MQSLSVRKCAAFIAVLVPLGLLQAPAMAEICVVIVDVLFLIDMARQRNLRWARQPWFMLASAWWLWLVFCSTPLFGFPTAGWLMGFAHAVVVIRLMVFAVALQTWLLVTPKSRYAAWVVLACCCLWIGLESWQQYLTGHNIFGDPRWADGSLTGPFWKPRAGAPYAHLLFTAMLPVVVLLYEWKGFWRICAIGLVVLGVVTSVLIGQRMATAFTGLGLVTAAFFIPQLRRVAIAAFVIAVLVIIATPVISPPTYGKLVQETARNLGHFSQSPYGELYTRAAVMTQKSPWRGYGFNGFRAFCSQPRFDAGLPMLNIPPTSLALGACNLHPHNFYMQSLTDAGVPGFILFSAMNIYWLILMGRGLWREPKPLRVGLFIGVLTFAWPLASTDDFTALYMAGWLFLFLGLGLATADATVSTKTMELNHV